MWTPRNRIALAPQVRDDLYTLARRALTALLVAVAIGYGLIVGIGAGITPVGTRVNDNGALMAGVQP